ncbi:MAG: glycine cleavage T C-terminal barrel domain-containing protein [Verrucomicrobiota bacterium]|jgi:folate-binding protein YgfZ
MQMLALHEFHAGLGARFAEANGAETVNDYGDWLAEYAALREVAGVLDLSFRGRICLVGNDRVRFLHGQVTNDVNKLAVGSGCYAALVTARGKMECDLNVFSLADELLLDFEPGLTGRISQRLERFIVADDVQIVDAAPHYGLLSVQGPKAEAVVLALGLFGVPLSGGPADSNPNRMNAVLPTKPFDSVKISDAMLGEIYLVNHARLFCKSERRPPARLVSSHENSQRAGPEAGAPLSGFDLFVPNASLGAVADKLIAAAGQINALAAPKRSAGRCGWQAFETARIEAGIPRFGVDMDETNLPLECGIENRAVSYNKGCYIGQEVINRVHSFGHVAKELRGLRLADDLKTLPQKHDKLFHNGRETGYVTSTVKSPSLNANIALGYVRREANQIGTELVLQTAAGESLAKIVELPFVK